MVKISEARNYSYRLKLLTLIPLIFIALLILCHTNTKESANAAGLSGKNTDFTVIEHAIGKTKAPHFVTGLKNRQIIKLDSLPQGGRPGEPVLPYSLVRILAPPDTDLSAVQSQLAIPDWQQQQGEYDIAAVRPAATWDGDKVILDWGTKDESLIIAGRDSSIYGEDAYFPKNPVEIVSVGKFRQWKLIEAKIWRAAYNPVQKKVRILADGQVAISARRLQGAAKGNSKIRVLPPLPQTSQAVRRPKVANPQDYETFYSLQQDAAGFIFDYVIITTNTIKSNSTKLSDFIMCKRACGHSVRIVTEGTSAGDTRYVSGDTADERADNIRAWLKSHYLTDGIEYVLLIGDPHPDNFTSSTSVPMKMCYPRNGAGSYEEAPSDMFFAELSGDWDLDGDNHYGEYVGDYGSGGADKYCEVHVGRIPFYNSYADLDSILQKMIDYSNDAGSLDWRDKALIAAAVSNFGPQDNNGDGDANDFDDYPDSDDRTFGDDWAEEIKSVASSEGFASYTLYEKEGIYSDGSAYSLTACDASLTAGNLLSQWQKQYGFVTWWGHGSQTSASRFLWTDDTDYPGICGNHYNHDETEWPVLFDTGYSSQLDNTHPSFVVQISCLNAYPENTNNLAYRLLKNGAIGTVAGTRVTWYALGPWDTGLGPGYGDNASYAYYIFDRMAGYDDTAAEALDYCRDYFGTESWGDTSWMNMIDFNFYGDPAISLTTACSQAGTPPVAEDCNVPAELQTPKTIQLYATDDGLPDPPASLTYIIESLPSQGTLSDPAAGIIDTTPYTLVNDGSQVVYTSSSATCFVGSDSFYFKVNDGGAEPQGGNSNNATVTINATIRTTTTIGTDTSGWELPMYTRYHDSRTQAIYQAGEIGRSGTITALALDIQTPPGQIMNNWTIRMKHTTLDSYDIPSLEADDWMVVYQNYDLPPHSGWRTYTFSAPFEYNGTDNLMVDFSYNNDSYSSEGLCLASSPGGTRSVYAYSDSGYGDPLTWSGTSEPTVSKSGNIPNIQLTKLEYPQRIPGDFEPDCDVDLDDLGFFTSWWLETTCDTSDWCGNADFEPDGDVDFDDFARFAAHWLE